MALRVDGSLPLSVYTSHMQSPKELALDRRIRKALKGKALSVAETLLADEEVHSLQDYANIVSIKRLHYNDHGPVHMRKVALNALQMMDLLQRKGVSLSLEREGAGTFEDSKIAVLLAAFLHDIGMTVGREQHEQMAVTLAIPIMDRILREQYGKDTAKRITVRSMAVEGIVGHMASQKIHSLEAGIILVADGCDMERGRARIPLILSTQSSVGDIHKYSATAIRRVLIEDGEERPIRIVVDMSESVGFFQVEEVLLRKIASSPVKGLIEVYAGVEGEKMKRYL